MTLIAKAIRHARSWFRARPIPVTYNGVRMASTLEADWACTFDSIGWEWSYEPIGLRLSDGQLYRCDFYLPGQRAWCEVKGPHDLRIDKPLVLWRDLRGDGSDSREPLVFIGREAIRGTAVIERADGSPMAIAECDRCDRYTLVDLDGAWNCRICGHWQERIGGVAPVPFAAVPYGSWRTAA